MNALILVITIYSAVVVIKNIIVFAVKKIIYAVIVVVLSKNIEKIKI